MQKSTDREENGSWGTLQACQANLESGGLVRESLEHCYYNRTVEQITVQVTSVIRKELCLNQQGSSYIGITQQGGDKYGLTKFQSIDHRNTQSAVIKSVQCCLLSRLCHPYAHTHTRTPPHTLASEQVNDNPIIVRGNPMSMLYCPTFPLSLSCQVCTMAEVHYTPFIQTSFPFMILRII